MLVGVVGAEVGSVRIQIPTMPLQTSLADLAKDLTSIRWITPWCPLPLPVGSVGFGDDKESSHVIIHTLVLILLSGTSSL